MIALKSWTDLEILNLENNLIDDLNGLSNLKDLEQLYLGNNQISNLSK